jgi:hypothetical protein
VLVRINPCGCQPRYGFPVADDSAGPELSWRARREPIASDPAVDEKVPIDDEQWLSRLSDELNRPLSAWICVLGWIASAELFLALIAVFGERSTRPPGSETSRLIKVTTVPERY